jgi:hypothetical protein
MSNALAVNIAATLAAGVASTVVAFVAATTGEIPILVAVGGGLCSLVAIAAIGSMFVGELRQARDWDAKSREGRRLAERSDAAYRLRRQDNGHMEELERALTSA